MSGSSHDRQSVFPATQYTWIEDRLAEGDTGLAAVRRHVMEVYAWPLSVYVKGSSFRTLGEADDLVAGFFASRLGRLEYLHDWRESGRPLRKWLMTGLRHFLFEQIKADRRNPTPVDMADDRGPAGAGSEDDDAALAFDRAFARQLVAEALRQTEASLAIDGLDLHWRVFSLHMIQGLPYDVVSEDLGVPMSRLSALCRTATRRFRSVTRRLVSWPGADQGEIEADIDELRTLLAGVETEGRGA